MNEPDLLHYKLWGKKMSENCKLSSMTNYANTIADPYKILLNVFTFQSIFVFRMNCIAEKRIMLPFVLKEKKFQQTFDVSGLNHLFDFGLLLLMITYNVWNPRAICHHFLGKFPLISHFYMKWLHFVFNINFSWNSMFAVVAKIKFYENCFRNETLVSICSFESSISVPSFYCCRK